MSAAAAAAQLGCERLIIDYNVKHIAASPTNYGQVYTGQLETEDVI